MKRGGKVNLRAKAKKAPTPRTVKMVDTKVLGLEPEVNGLVLSKLQLATAYNWYNYFHTSAESKKWAIDQISLTDKALANRMKSIPDSNFSTTVGWICKLESRGAQLSQETLLWRHNKIKELLASAEKPKEEKVSNIRYKPPAYTQDIINIEKMLDDYIETGYKEHFVVYDYLVSNDTKKLYAINIAEYYKPLAEELAEVVEGKNKDLNEGYNHLTKAQKVSYSKLVQSIVDDCDRWSSNKTKTSKAVRTPKKKTNEQILKSFKYLQSIPNLKVVSVDPSSIIGAKTVIAYNNKYRKIIQYNAIEGQTLTIKGTSLVGVDETTSFHKTLRKPEEQLGLFSSGTLAFTKKAFENIKTSSGSPSVRFSNEVIPLRTFK